MTRPHNKGVQRTPRPRRGTLYRGAGAADPKRQGSHWGITSDESFDVRPTPLRASLFMFLRALRAGTG